MSDINEIKNILHEASPAPWKWVDSLPHRNQGGFVNGVNERICDFGNQIDYYPTEGTSPSYYDELLIANAPEWLSSLITTIESQKEEIRRRVIQAEINIGLGETVINMQAETESLKAITELAVKGLTEIRIKGIDPLSTKVAISTLSEIERLQNAHIQPKSPS